MSECQRSFIREIPTKDDFLHILKENTGVLLFKFGATWCKPCKQIDEFVTQRFSEMRGDVLCAVIDIDDNFEIYAILKKKRIVQSIPTILRYDCGNITYIPDDVVTGTDIPTLELFFEDLIE
jgi:thioredoxin-like negative regulator of GroEL|tara:strand:+ start:1250 stop:1615 length:366 start_codon:yes stop_codon:yes gene_type:complete